MCTIYEPVFLKKADSFLRKLFCQSKIVKSPKNYLLARGNTQRKDNNDNNKSLQDEKSFSMVFDNNINSKQNFSPQKKNDSDSSEEDNFEEGSNQIEMRSEVDIVDGQKFENLVTDYANFDQQFSHMSIKQKTSYFVSLKYLIILFRLSILYS